MTEFSGFAEILLQVQKEKGGEREQRKERGKNAKILTNLEV